MPLINSHENPPLIFSKQYLAPSSLMGRSKYFFLRMLLPEQATMKDLSKPREGVDQFSDIKKQILDCQDC